MVSLAGAIEAPSTLPSTSYDMFLRATQAITRHAGDVADVFRRMVFNILACNRDDDSGAGGSVPRGQFRGGWLYRSRDH